MEKRGIANWVTQPKTHQILLSFSVPKTPRQVERELDIKKLKLKTFLEKHLLESLNPEARKARFYVLSSKARRLLKLPCSKKETSKDWNLVGWIMASHKQRLVILKTLDSKKRTSEEIRERASKLNPHLTRISTKGILKELLNKKLAETKMNERKRYYWVSDMGKLVVEDTITFS